MNDFKKIYDNDLIKPNYNEANIIDLIRTIYNYCGTNFKQNKNIKKIQEIIVNKKHIIFVVVDGLGSNLLENLPNNSLLKQNKKTDIISVFPSATGCVLNSLATAQFPSKTGIYGWYGYYRKKDLNFYTLLLKDRKTNENLQVNNSEIFKYKSKINQLKRNKIVLYPNYLVDSRYSKYVAEDNIRVGYSDYKEAIERIKTHILNQEKTFTYLYIPEIDSLEHKYGVKDKKVYDKIKELEEAIELLLPLNEETELIITADHGQTDITDIITMNFAKYNKYFYALPSIDMGTATYFVKPEFLEEFSCEFEKDYNEKMLLYETNKMIDKGFFGEKPSNYAKESLGEFVSVCKKGYAFYNALDDYDDSKCIKGNHTGLTKDEMFVPLIVINNIIEEKEKST